MGRGTVGTADADAARVAAVGGPAPAPTPVRGADDDTDTDTDTGVPSGPRRGLLPEGAGAGDRPEAGEPGGGRRERVWLALRERLPLWVQVRCGLEPKTLAALVVVLLVAVVLAVQHFWSGRPQPVSAPETVREEVAVTGAAREPAPSPGVAPPASVAVPAPAVSPAGRVVVDVSGTVRSPGVHRLPLGSRVADALRAAGGVEPGTDLTGLNRARVLVDGEQVVVGGPAPPVPGTGIAPGGSSAGPGAGGAAGDGAPVSLSTATVEQLDTLPGVGPVLARHIVDYRTRHGGFRSVGELREVNGIGERRFADIEPRVRP